MPNCAALPLQAAAAEAEAAGATRLPNLAGMPPEMLQQLGLAAMARNPLERVRLCSSSS